MAFSSISRRFMSIAPYFSNIRRGRNLHSTTMSLIFGLGWALNFHLTLREVALELSTPGLVNTFSALISSRGTQAYITQLFFSSYFPTPDTHPRPLRSRFFRCHIHPCPPQTHTPDRFGAVFFAVIFIRAHTPDLFRAGFLAVKFWHAHPIQF